VERLLDVAAEVHAQHAAAAALQHLVVAGGLGADQCSEVVALARDRNFGALVGGELEEDAAVGPALVELSGGVEEARPVAERGREPGGGAARDAQALQALVAL